MSSPNTPFAVGAVGMVFFFATAILAAVAAADSKWAVSETLDSRIGVWRACGVAFGQPGRCADIEEGNVLFVASAPSRFARIQGIRALTILSCFIASAGVLLCILIAIRSKRPSPQLCGAPIYAGIVTFIAGLLSLVLFSTLKTDAFRFISGLDYGPSFGCCIAYTVLSLLVVIPFAALTHLAWEDALLAARVGGPGGGIPSSIVTPKARAAFLNLAASP